jgi:hypothetical protein
VDFAIGGGMTVSESDTAIDVLADRTRALPVNDPEDRELTISCGCAVFNFTSGCRRP